MNLYLFPDAPVTTNGYGLAVLADYKKLSPSEDDHVIWYTNNHKHSLAREGDYFISKSSYVSFNRLKHLLKREVSTEISTSQIHIHKSNFKDIFCGDVIAYRALRKLYPTHKITVRFHNCFSRIKNRMTVINMKSSDIRFNINLLSLTRLENEIFRDKNCDKIFISQEDYDYYKLTTGRTSDALIWPFNIDIEKGMKQRQNLKPCKITKFVWFGGAESHKIDSIIWFRDQVFPQLLKQNVNLEFHLWGKNTEKLQCTNSKVFAHGFYPYNDFPFKFDSLYVNPDLIGGGIKTKLQTYYENGIPFITTPFGFEGYESTLIDNQYCIVAQPEDWINTIQSKILTHI